MHLFQQFYSSTQFIRNYTIKHKLIQFKSDKILFDVKF